MSKELDIPEFLKGQTKTIVSMYEPEFKKYMHRFYRDGVKDGRAVGTVQGFVIGALVTILFYVIYMTCFATHMLPMTGP